MHQVMMIKSVLLKKEEARKGDDKTSITPTSMITAVKPKKSTNYNTQYFSIWPGTSTTRREVLSVVPAEKRYWVLCYSTHPELKSL